MRYLGIRRLELHQCASPFSPKNHAGSHIAGEQSAACNHKGVITIVTGDTRGEGGIGHGMSRRPAVKNTSSEKAPLEISRKRPTIIFCIRMGSTRNSLQDIVIKKCHCCRLGCHRTSIVQGLVVADEIHVAGHKNWKEGSHHHAGRKGDAKCGFVLASGKPSHL